MSAQAIASTSTTTQFLAHGRGRYMPARGAEAALQDRSLSSDNAMRDLIKNTNI
jgi:hypothetical protein